MSSVQCLRELMNERLTAAAEEIFRVFQETISEYEKEIDRQRILLDIVWKPEIKLHRTELPQQHVCKEEEVLADQQLCDLEKNSSLDQEDPEPPQIKEEQKELCTSLDQEDPEPLQIKEEQEELCTSLEGEQLVLKQETETFMLTPTCDESEDQTLDLSPDEAQREAEKEHVVSMSVKSSVEPEPNSDDQLFSHNSHVAESQDHKRGKYGDSGSTRKAEPKLKKRPYRSKNHTNNEDNSTTLKIHSNTDTGEKSFKCDICGKSFMCKSILHRHLRVHTELPQQHVCKEEEVLADQQLCDLEKNSSLDQEDPEPPQIKEEQKELCTSLDQEDPEPPQIKEEQKELCTSLEGEWLVLKQETETFMLTPTCDESEDQTLDLSPDEAQSEAEEEHVVSMSVQSSVVPEPNNDDQLFSHNSHVAESQDHKRGKHGDSGSTRKAEPKLKKRRHRRKNHTNNEDNSTKLKIHNNTDTGEKSLKCGTCGKSFMCKSILHRHLRVHTGDRPYPCNTCEKRFSQPGALKAHLRIHTGEKPYPCNTCEKRFSQLSQLKAHMTVHTGEKPYSCNTCGKRFSRLGQLKVHMTIHTGEKPYSCNTCGKRFSQLGALNLHMRTHTGEKPYSCNTCGKRFSQLGALNLHMRTHTGEKPYSCNTCEKRFSQLGALNVHLRVHTGEKPYPCNTCEKRFTQLSKLKRHMTIHTG
ncbi:zinc finger protein 271-like [Thunnus thynnus]|uniref:zinc finger protein 271-like n=1 Tax=Thunnus thynnus TaxID=8237 RepID=UPI003527E2B5